MPIVTALTLFTLLFVLTHRTKAQSIVSTPNRWTYDKPSQWGSLDPAFSACSDGRSQSPIDLSSSLLPAKPLLPPSLRFYYDDLHSTLTAVNASHHTTLNNGHSIVPTPHTLATHTLPRVCCGSCQLTHSTMLPPVLLASAQMVKYDNAASHTTYRDNRYQLLQFHFHAPSEHTIDNKPADMELHLVHADANGRLLVVGFMIQADEKEEEEEEERKKRGVTSSNSALDFLNALLWSHLPTAASGFHTQSNPSSTSPAPSSSSSPLLYRLQSALSSSSASSPLFYHYPGSLTTPPCTEGVEWFVDSSLLHISRSQLSAYTNLFPHTNRPVQPLNGREVVVLGGVAVDEAASAGGLAVVLFFVVVAVALLVLWYWQHSHARHTLGEMMDASVQQNVNRDKQADALWRRDRDVTTTSTAAAGQVQNEQNEEDTRPLLFTAANATSTSIAQPSTSPVGKVMRRSTGSRGSSNGNLYGIYKHGEEDRKVGGADEPKSSPKPSPTMLVRR